MKCLTCVWVVSSDSLRGSSSSMTTHLFILWHRVDNCDTIQLICDDIPSFKRAYKAHRHLTTDSTTHRWTRENID